MVCRFAVDEEDEEGEPRDDGRAEHVEDHLPPEGGRQRATQQHPRHGTEVSPCGKE